MNRTVESILKQLSNEGVSHSADFGVHMFTLRFGGRPTSLSCETTLRVAVDQAINHSVRILALLSKLHDALRVCEEGTLEDMLVERDGG